MNPGGLSAGLYTGSITVTAAGTGGAVVVPLMTSGGCVGVFAVELQHRGEQREPVRALATKELGEYDKDRIKVTPVEI